MAAREILFQCVFSILIHATQTYREPSPSAQSLTDTWQLDPFVEMPTSSSAKNGAVTTYSWADPLGRLKSIDRTPGNITTRQRNVITYQDTLSPQRVDSATDRLNPDDGQVKAYICYDGLGREIKTLARLTPAKWEIVDKEYSGFGDLRRVSNPYPHDTGSAPGDSSICTLTEKSISLKCPCAFCLVFCRLLDANRQQHQFSSFSPEPHRSG